MIGHGQPASQYASDLLDLAARGRLGAMPRAALPMAFTSRVESRLRAILDAGKSRSSLTCLMAAIIVLGALAFVLPLAMVHAADKSSPKPSSATSQPATQRAPATQPVDDRITYQLRVVDENNQPIGGVSAWVTKDYPSFPICQPDSQTVSEVFECKPDGSAQWNWPRDVKTNFFAYKKGFVPTFIRGVSLTTDAPYTIFLKKGQPIRGIVRRPGGEPIADARVKAVPDKFLLDFQPEFTLEGVTDAQGRFTLEHGAGKYIVTAVVERALPPIYTEAVNVEVPVDRSPAPVEMVALPGASIKGRMVTTQNIQLAGRSVLLALRLPKNARREIHTGPDGAFTVDGIPPNALGQVAFFDIGNYIAVLDWPTPPPGCRTSMSSINFSGVAPGVYDNALVHLYKPAIFDAMIRDEQGKPFEKLGVVMEPWSRIFYTDANGHVAARMPPMVDVTVRYLNSREKIETLQLTEGETVTRQLTHKRPVPPVYENEITGQVVDETGAPVGAARVFVGNHGVVPQEEMREHNPKPTWTWGTLMAASTGTDNDGRFKLNLLKAGTTDLWAEREGVRWSIVRDVQSNAKNLKLVLRPADVLPTFKGVVTEVDGHPVENAHIALFSYDNAELRLMAETNSSPAGQFEIMLSAPPPARSREVRMICRTDSGDITWKVLPRCGMDNIKLQFKPQASVTGRLVDARDNPLPSARVWLYYGQDPLIGNMQFYYDTEKLGPTTTTDAQGRFTLSHLPRGCTVSLYAKHPDTDRGEVWYIKDVQPDTKIPDIVAKEGITMLGTVRFPDGKPAPGATVTLKSWFGSGRIMATAVADASGAYRIAGIEHMGISQSRLFATFANDDVEWEGAHQADIGQLYGGDIAREIDITLEHSMAWRKNQWLAQKAPAIKSRYRIAMIDDSDPATEGKPSYDDEIALYDDSGNQLWKQKGLGVAWGRAPMAHDPSDHSIYVFEYLAHALTKFGPDGKVIWRTPPLADRISIQSIAVDGEDGNIWALTSAGTIYGQNLVVYTREGKEARSFPIAGSGIAYSPHDRCFWVTGKRLMKVSREGKVLLEPSVNFAYYSRDISVNSQAGSVWINVMSHPEVPDSHNRLYIIAGDGQVRLQKDTDRQYASRITVDAPRGVADSIRTSCMYIDHIAVASSCITLLRRMYEPSRSSAS